MRPVPRWLTVGALVVAGLFGVAAGVGAFTFVYAKGSSYLTNDPAACVNCHVMREQFEGWLKSSHHTVATCNDCHTPASPIAKWWVKGRNGYHHSSAFTLGGFHEPIRITASNRAVTEAQCRHCHADLVVTMEGPHAGGEGLSCIRCHDSVGHLSAD